MATRVGTAQCLTPLFCIIFKSGLFVSCSWLHSLCLLLVLVWSPGPAVIPGLALHVLGPVLACSILLRLPEML